MKIQITAGGSTFDAVLYDSETAEAFAALLPLTLTMEELHGNEKYYDLDSVLPNAEIVPGSIHAGDLKLFGTSCVVLFYQDFSSNYAYTDLGRLDDPAGLAQALGTGRAEVTFTKQEDAMKQNRMDGTSRAPGCCSGTGKDGGRV